MNGKTFDHWAVYKDNGNGNVTSLGKSFGDKAYIDENLSSTQDEVIVMKAVWK